MTEPISLRNPGFYGVRDYTISDVGPIAHPGSSAHDVSLGSAEDRLGYPDIPDLSADGFRVRVFFPSWDGAVWSAPIAEGTYPLVVFLHGERNAGDGICPPDFANDYQHWWAALYRLAATGVIVAVPDLTGVISADPNDVVPRLQQTITYMRHWWDDRESVAPRLGLAGHSWGANAAINAAVSGQFDVDAYASVAATRETNFGPDYKALRIPTLLLHGMDDLTRAPFGRQDFDLGPTPRYQVALAGIDHWDWFARLELRRCAGPGPTCLNGAWIVSEMLASFFARHLNGDDAVVPWLLETPEPKFPVGGADLSSLNGSACSARVIFRTADGENLLIPGWLNSVIVEWGPVPWWWQLVSRLVRHGAVTIGTWSGPVPPF